MSQKTKDIPRHPYNEVWHTAKLIPAGPADVSLYREYPYIEYPCSEVSLYRSVDYFILQSSPPFQLMATHLERPEHPEQDLYASLGFSYAPSIALFTQSAMEVYQYEKLSLTVQEIQLLQLLPGDFDDEIRFTIYNVPMVEPKLNPRPKRMSLEKLQETVPRGWTAMETLQGRYVFLRDNTNSEHTSWKHPYHSFDHSLYESFNPDLYLDYEPTYDALSYTWGSPDIPEVALVGSGSFESSTQIMKIGENLALALRYLRYTQKPRTLWVDAIASISKIELNVELRYPS